MDNSSKLQALLGDKGDSEEPFDWNKYCPAKPQHLYEGTDSDDDEIITSRRVEGGDSNAPQPELRCMPGNSAQIPSAGLRHLKLILVRVHTFTFRSCSAK